MTIIATYDPYLVALSISIACLASYTALDLSDRINGSRRWARLAWLATAAIAMGGGIWSMHFIGMLAFVMPMPVSYHLGLTLLSLVVAIGATGLGFFMIRNRRVTQLEFPLSGIFMGIGIISMHYIGMAAMRMPANIRYDTILVTLSVLIAIGASIIALWLAFRTTITWQRLLAAVVMGSAISGMHYTGMAAATFIANPEMDGARGEPALEQTGVALAIATITFVILLLALVASAFDRKLAQRSRELDEQNRRLHQANDELMAAEEQVRLLMREMHHRGKNTLSLVQAIARQTATSGPEHFVERFTHRIQALATNQDLLVQTRWQGVDVDDLVRAQLAHFSDLMGYRISFNGPNLRLNGVAAQSIGMALHELATNAGKYGALSTDAGRVDVVWRVDSAIFKMAWTERQGPPVTPPDGRGFGSTVVEAMAKRAVNGEVQLEFDPAGVVWHLSCPAANALESQERGRNQEKQRSS
jgi:NO-binding membrane sensor protein with MHYT domain/two-component sensor histidine kinase